MYNYKKLYKDANRAFSLAKTKINYLKLIHNFQAKELTAFSLAKTKLELSKTWIKDYKNEELLVWLKQK